MFLIFGVKRLRRRLGMAFALCDHCGTPAAQVVTRIGTWFSLFFVPVIPLGTKYVSTCTFCGVSTKIDKIHATQMTATAQEGASVSSEKGTPPPDGVVRPPGLPTTQTES